MIWVIVLFVLLGEIQRHNCRPIQICYEKETNELCQAVLTDIENQIRLLNKSVVRLLISEVLTVEVRVSFDLALTMIDGKSSQFDIK